MANKVPVPSEYEECKVLARYLNSLGIKFTHIPNETRTTSQAQKMKNKMLGVSSGIPDYMFIIPRDRMKKRPSMVFDLLVFMEMKRQKGGNTSPKQVQRLGDLANTGAYCCVCCGFMEAKEVIDGFLYG